MLNTFDILLPGGKFYVANLCIQLCLAFRKNDADFILNKEVLKSLMAVKQELV